MKLRAWLQLLAWLALYAACVLAWNAAQALGLGRSFIYSVF